MVATASEAVAAQSISLPIVGVLALGSADGRQAPIVAALTAALVELGLEDGRTIRLLVRDSRGKPEDLAAQAAALVDQKPAVIVAGGAAVTNVLKRITSTTPIVTSGAAVDPVRAGWAESYARPGGTITGLMLTNDDLTAKQIEIFRQLVPTMRHLGVIWSATNAAARETGSKAVAAAQAAGLRSTLFPVHRETLDAILDEAQSMGVDAILAIADPPMDDLRERLAETVLRRRLPAAGQLPFYADAGLLMTYSADLSALHRRSAEFVQKILRGTPPGEIPFEAPSKIVLRINARTARSLSLDLSPLAISLADDVLD